MLIRREGRVSKKLCLLLLHSVQNECIANIEDTESVEIRDVPQQAKSIVGSTNALLAEE